MAVPVPNAQALPRMLQAPRGAACPFPEGFPSFSAWLCKGCLACSALSLTSEKSNIQLSTHLPFKCVALLH